MNQIQESPTPSTLPASVVKLRTVAASVFLLLYLFNFVVRALILADVVSGTENWFFITIGTLSFIGFSLLYWLSTTYVGEIFSVIMLLCQVFFSFVMPTLYKEHSSEVMYLQTLLYICVGFCLISIYAWCMLFSNIKFPRRILVWITVLPIPSIYYICESLCRLRDLDDKMLNTFVRWWFDNSMIPFLMFILIPCVAVGFWRLCFCKLFMGRGDIFGAKGIYFQYPTLSPFNSYGCVYLGITALLVVLIFLP